MRSHINTIESYSNIYYVVSYAKCPGKKILPTA